MQMGLYHMWPFVTGFFHLASCSQVSAKLRHASVPHCFWVDLFIHSSRDGRVGCLHFRAIVSNAGYDQKCAGLCSDLPPQALTELK